MRIILEKNEIIQILNEKFETEFIPENVIIRTDPFEIELRDVPFPNGDAKSSEETEKPVVKEDDLATTLGNVKKFHERSYNPNASLEAPPLDAEELGDGNQLGELNLNAFSDISGQLAAELKKQHPSVYNRNQRQEGSFNPPTDFNQELS